MSTLQEFLSKGPLKPAEDQLVRAVRAQTPLQLRGTVPSEPDDEIIIRADFLRYIALGGCDDCRPGPRGVNIGGAWIEDQLDLVGCVLPQPFVALGCQFRKGVAMMDAQTRLFSLNYSRLYPTADDPDAFSADRAVIEGNLTMRDIQAYGTIRLAGIHVRGQLSLNDAYVNTHLSAEEQTASDITALHFDAAEVDGDLFLQDMVAVGRSRLVGAQFRGDVFMNRAVFQNRNGISFDMEGTHVRGEVSIVEWAEFDGAKTPTFLGSADFSRSEIGFFRDGPETLPNADRLIIEGMNYGRINMSGVTVDQRIDWVKRAAVVIDPGTGKQAFRSQPWTQLINFLKNQGDLRGARSAGRAMERERRRLKAVSPWLMRRLHWLYGWVVDYGYSPFKALSFALGFILIGTVLFWGAWRDGVMVPAHEVLLDDKVWLDCAGSGDPNPAQCWAEKLPGRDYEAFNAFLYSFDVFLPIVTIEMEGAWTPSTSRGRALADTTVGGMVFDAALDAPVVGPPVAEWLAETSTGDFVWAWRFIHEILGYVISGFAVAGAARLVRD